MQTTVPVSSALSGQVRDMIRRLGLEQAARRLDVCTVTLARVGCGCRVSRAIERSIRQQLDYSGAKTLAADLARRLVEAGFGKADDHVPQR